MQKSITVTGQREGNYDKKNNVFVGSGNVFEDLDFLNPEEHLAKARIASRIYDVIIERKISQKQAAKLLEIDQSRISDLLRGRFDRFSTDKLLNFLLALGQNVEIVISPSRKRNGKASLSVSTAASRTKLHGTKAA